MNDVYKVGDEIVITLDPINSTGAITVTINGKSYDVESGNKVNITGGLSEGTYTIVANLANDTKYESSSNSTVFKVVKNNLTIVLGDIVDMIYVGSPVTFTATLSENVIGDVIFTINGANYTVKVNNAKEATYTYTPVNNETLTVVATFVGNDKYNGNSSVSKDFTVNRVASTITLSDVTIEVGEIAKIIVTVTDGATGVVNVTVNGETQSVGLVNSKATVYVFGLVFPFKVPLFNS